MVDTGLSPKGRLDHWLILYLPVEVVYRFVDRIAEVILNEHWVPTEVEGTTHVETLAHTDTVIVRSVGAHELSLAPSWIIALSS